MATVTLDVFPGVSAGFGSEAGRRLVLEQDVIEGETVRDLFHRLAHELEGFDKAIFDTETQSLRQAVSLVVNGRLIELVQGLDTRLRGGDVILLLPAFSGG